MNSLFPFSILISFFCAFWVSRYNHLYNCYFFLMNWSFYHYEIFKASSEWGWRGSEHGSLAENQPFLLTNTPQTVVSLCLEFEKSLFWQLFENVLVAFMEEWVFRSLTLPFQNCFLLVFKVNINCPLKNVNHSLLLNILNLLLG